MVGFLESKPLKLILSTKFLIFSIHFCILFLSIVLKNCTTYCTKKYSKDLKIRLDGWLNWNLHDSMGIRYQYLINRQYAEDIPNNFQMMVAGKLTILAQSNKRQQANNSSFSIEWRFRFLIEVSTKNSFNSKGWIILYNL